MNANKQFYLIVNLNFITALRKSYDRGFKKNNAIKSNVTEKYFSFEILPSSIKSGANETVN